MRLLFVRHAESTGNTDGRWQGHADYPLSDEGRAQADRLGRRLRAEGLAPTHVYTSPLRRAAQTSEILTRSWPVDAVPWDDLKENDIGAASGLTREEAVRSLPEVDFDREASRQFAGVRGAESLRARRNRGRRVVDTLLDRHANGVVVVLVSHGGILQHVISALLGANRTWGYAARNTALSDFDVDVDRWRLADETLVNTNVCRINRFNDASHLDAAPGPEAW